MAYVPLHVRSGDDAVDDLFKRVIEPYLREIHYLLAATWPSPGPDGHFPHSCAVMLLATVAATSALPNYQRGCKLRTGDKLHFMHCVKNYFPWDGIRIEDYQLRNQEQLIETVSQSLYTNFRCPLFHSGGLVASSDMGIHLVKVHPGQRNISDAELRIEDLAGKPSLNGQVVIRLEHRSCTLYVDYFYWCVRKLVERFAADPIQAEAIRPHSRK